MKSKYGNKKVILNGEQFDSKREAKRYMELKLLERAGAIQHLARQVKFELIPSQRDIETGKVIERPCTYVADFTYYLNGRFIVEDCKGFRTDAYKIKRKLFYQKYGIAIKET